MFMCIFAKEILFTTILNQQQIYEKTINVGASRTIVVGRYGANHTTLSAHERKY